MLQPDSTTFGAHIKHHEFAASGLKGVLVYSVDQGPIVRISFSRLVQVTIWVLPDQEQNELSDINPMCSQNLGICAELEAESLIHTTAGAVLLKDENTWQRRKSCHIQTKGSFQPDGNKSTPQDMEDTSDESDSMKSLSSIPVPSTLGQAKSRDKLMCNTDSECQDEAGEANEKKEIVTNCQYCGRDFATLRDFYDHRRSEGSSHRCDICGKVELFKAHLLVHMQRHEKVQLEDTKDTSILQSEMDMPKSKASKKEKAKCTVCGLVVSSIDSLKIHTMLHTGESPYRCCVCGDVFSSLSSRQHHMDTHITVDRFQCKSCNLRFSSRAELAKHQLNHQFQCGLCGEEFPNKTSRNCHYRVAHSQDILRCDQCPALFSCPESLQRHKQYHARGQKQQCPTCGQVVTRLKEHMLLHSSTPPPRLFVCDQCPMSYLRKANLERHMRTHTGEKPYVCSHCPKRFNSNGMLRKHLLTHTQERPFQCEVCGKRCAQRSNLIVHMRVHNSERLFSCSICGQSFNHKNSFKGHLRSKHSRQSPPADPMSVVSDQERELASATNQIEMTSASSLGPTNSTVLESRPDYTQLLQLSYTNNLFEAAQPAHSVSFN